MDIDTLRAELTQVADAQRAPQMAAYMRDQFPFLGVQAKQRRAAARPVMAAAKAATSARLFAFAAECWAQPEREFHYVACDVLGANTGRLEMHHIARLQRLITTKSWWDTVDPLAAHTAGGIVAAHPGLVVVMDTWIDSDNFWLARTAILHQLRYGEDTDAKRLFAYAEARAGDTEFFIRKAIGWALRQYARVDPAAVRTFVAQHEDRLSGLTTREALKHLGR
ncbi:MAG: DNA alkylation repair protein [Microthrixaceae bacterium]